MIDKATDQLFQYGVVGVMLVIALVAIYFLFRFMFRQMRTQQKEFKEHLDKKEEVWMAHNLRLGREYTEQTREFIRLSEGYLNSMNQRNLTLQNLEEIILEKHKRRKQ